ncbi:putative translation initiation factor E4 [Babesia divergens]|uniref:Translation initiation factor E4 n=1 Tax=Babesia divergens TaxID=32595 RepID=A0AAD9GFI6_BABDI|nr:putative translation initiation factor E4 [Babesia divergens]
MVEPSNSGTDEAHDAVRTAPLLTFNKNVEDYRKVSRLFDSTKMDINTSLTLKNKWVIWEQIVKKDDQRHASDYKGHTKPLVSFDSVQKPEVVINRQSFWNLWFNIPQPSELSTTKRLARECVDGTEHFVDAIMLFRQDIQPMWEDPLNQDGGHFDYRFRPNDVTQLTVDEYWNNIVLGLVGSSIPQGEFINGVRLVDKLASKYPVIRIEVWFKNLGESNDATQLMKSIGTCMARRLDGSVGPIPKGDLKWH